MWVSVFLAAPVSGLAPAITVTDAAGTIHNAAPRAAGQQLNFFLPSSVAIGPAQLRIASPFPSTILLDIQPVSPGIFVSPNRAAWGLYQTKFFSWATFGFCSGTNCIQNPIPVPAWVSLTTGGIALAGGRSVTVWLAGQRLPGTVSAGVTFDIPPNFPYRGYVPVQFEISGVRSNIAYVHLLDEGI